MRMLWISSYFALIALVTGQDYVSYTPGDAGYKIILSAPHGGSLKPSGTQEREAGCPVTGGCDYTFTCSEPDSELCGVSNLADSNTAQLAQELRDALCNISVCPALIVNNLHRSRLDANREKAEATFGVTAMETAYDQYFSYLQQAQDDLTTRGLLFDLHGHSHTKQRIELGYLVTKKRLNNDNPNWKFSSIRRLYSDNKDDTTFEELLRGSVSLGGLLQDEGVSAIPSPANPKPNDDKYFTGGYITRQKGSRYSSSTSTNDAIQLECSSEQRDATNRATFVANLAVAVKNFMDAYY